MFFQERGGNDTGEQTAVDDCSAGHGVRDDFVVESGMLDAGKIGVGDEDAGGFQGGEGGGDVFGLGDFTGGGVCSERREEVVVFTVENMGFAEGDEEDGWFGRHGQND